MAEHTRITIRQPIEFKRKIERAAATRGMTVTGFINAVLERAAVRTLSRVRHREHSERPQQRLLDLLGIPSGSNAPLRRAAAR